MSVSFSPSIVSLHDIPALEAKFRSVGIILWPTRRINRVPKPSFFTMQSGELVKMESRIDPLRQTQ